MFRSIAVPLDGSPAAEGALGCALSLARATGARLELLHVHQTYRPGAELEGLPIYGWQGIVAYDDAQDENTFGHEWQDLHALAARLADQGVRADAKVLRGEVAEAIASYAHTNGTDVIVMSRHGRGGLKRALLGSTAEAVVRQSATPVLLVHAAAADHATPAMRRILVPLDGSAFAEWVLQPVLQLALASSAEVMLLRIIKPGYTPSFLHAHAPPGPEEYLERVREALPMAVGPVETRVLADHDPALRIVEEAEENGYDLVAMATHGQGGPRSMLLGSTAHRVLQGSRRPLLLFRPPHATAEPVVKRGQAIATA